MMTKDGMYCSRCEQRVTGQGSTYRRAIYRRRSIRYHCPLCSGPVQTRTVIGSPATSAGYDKRTFFPDDDSAEKANWPPLGTHPRPTHTRPKIEPKPTFSEWVPGAIILLCAVVVIVVAIVDQLLG